MARKIKGTLYRRGQTYWLEYVANGQRFRQSLKVTREEEAKRERDKILAPLVLSDEAERLRAVAAALASAEERQAKAVEAARKRLALADVWDKHPYLTNARGSTERPLAARSIVGAKALWATFTDWAASAGLTFADEVTPAHVEAFRDSAAERGQSGDNVNRALTIGRMMLRRAGMKPNPFDGVRKLAYTPAGRRELTTNELRKVCTVATGDLRVLFALGIYTGARLGDLCRLDWSAVASDLSVIVIRPGKTAATGKEVTVPLHPVLKTILSETQPARRHGPVLPDLGATYERDPSAVTKAVGRHFESCGIRLHRPGTGKTVDHKTGKKITKGRAVVEVGFHSLRHSFVTQAARQGVPLHVVQALAGHSSPEIQRRYLHASSDDARRAVAALPDIMSAAPKALPAPAEPERERLAAKARTVSIAAVRAALAAIEATEKEA